jgi:hypothetical protein
MTSEDKALLVINLMTYFSKYRVISGNLSFFTAEQLTEPYFACWLLDIVAKKDIKTRTANKFSVLSSLHLRRFRKIEKRDY